MKKIALIFMAGCCQFVSSVFADSLHPDHIQEQSDSLPEAGEIFAQTVFW